MSTVTLRIPDDKHERLKRLAQSWGISLNRGISLNKLMEEWATIALAEFDAKTRFMALAAGGKPARGLALLDELDQLEAG